jgi:2-oxoglutarate ferredoxin oxidoreductase subunit alpha
LYYKPKFEKLRRTQIIRNISELYVNRKIYISKLIIMKKDITIVLSGEAGQGIKTVEKLFIHSLQEEKLHFFSTSEVMSRVRGGNNTTEIRIGSPVIQSFKESIDVLIVLGKNGTERVQHRLHKDSRIIGEEKNIPESIATSFSTTYVPFKDIANEAGNPVLTNTVILGYVLGMLGLQQKIGKKQLQKTFKEKEEKIITQNIEALKKGYEIGKDAVIKIDLPRTKSTPDKIILNGTQAIGLGAIAGGCNFMAAYPMSPGTGVLEFLAHQAETFGIVVEQAEDEIAAINMVLGSWYAGGRAMTTTSGGGFALMEEGISLSGMTEVPSVTHIGMRPGPATGLPTRTEQGDLMLAVFAGHGEFPKIVLAPGSLDECIHISQKAFDLAATYGVPVIILSDQFLLDSYSLTEKPDFSDTSYKKHITKTTKKFETYKITENGISPRGVPGHGNGFVCVDSDEHDETGRITEDADVRTAMMEKRLKKNKLITQHVIEPTIIGDSNFSTLIISWGSTYGVIAEALENKKIKGLAYAHFSQVFPLPNITKKLTEQAKRIVVIENNASGQFAKLIQMELGIKIHENILQYNGFPFSIEHITSVIDSELSRISKK